MKLYKAVVILNVVLVVGSMIYLACGATDPEVAPTYTTMYREPSCGHVAVFRFAPCPRCGGDTSWLRARVACPSCFYSFHREYHSLREKRGRAVGHCQCPLAALEVK